jgi:hypothetical protein
VLIKWKDTQLALIQASELLRLMIVNRTSRPGNYTIVERGNDNTTGIGLIEVYKIP